jgi:hypothetical protein
MTQPTGPANPPSTASGADLLRGAAHLLRTPLGVVLGMSATLRDYDHRFTAEQRTLYLGEVFKAAEEMRVALDGMSLLARLVAGTLTFAPAAVPISELATSATEALASIWGAGTVTVEPSVGSHVSADAQRFTQAFESLARVFGAMDGTAVAAEEGATPTLRLGPVTSTHGAENLSAITAPVATMDLAEVVARPGGWALLTARYLLEGQGARLVRVDTEPVNPPAGATTFLIQMSPATA